jgi:hypothetical protein
MNKIIMSFAGKWIELEIIMLCEINHYQKVKSHMLTLMQNLDQNKRKKEINDECSRRIIQGT